ncbi:MAG: hypothetical protein A2286_13305 [Gammaproteobacteria bacterium RIFOXYA12_FULL_61_12]|nr:MAG: hypothetical protein A2286_13305 [Gammaproteobacteria bacterium RIFOXYA12_FULL_61_12]
MPEQKQYEISPLKLWSPLQRQLAACGLIKGSPQQWIGTIRNLQKKGVSAVEIEWSDVMRMLGDVPESERVFHELVALAASLSGESPPTLAEPLPSVVHVSDLLAFLETESPCELVLQRHVSNEYVPQVRYEKQQRPAKLPPAVVVHGRREVKLLHYRDRTFGICILLHLEVDTGLFGRHRYWSLSVPRGERKLATHPVGRQFASSQEALAYGRALVGCMARRLSQEGFVGQTKALNHFMRYSLPGGDSYTEWLITAPNLSGKYWGEHFDLPNIVAHVRTSERNSLEGSRLLVMEEIQSDWNQALRAAKQELQLLRPDEGEGVIEWDDDVDLPPDNPYLNHWLDAALRMMLLAAHRGFSGISWLPGKLHAERFPWAKAEGLATFYDRIVPSAIEKLAKSWGAQVGTAEISTLSRCYRVQKVQNRSAWRVLNRRTGMAAGGEFDTIDAADNFCQSLEFPVLEIVGALHLTHAMRADILTTGLPCLGAIGKRAVAVPPALTSHSVQCVSS